MYKKLLIFTFSVIGITMLLGMLPIHGETDVYENVVRLHVLANSDTEEDQALKIKVRDAVLSNTKDMLSNCDSKEEAQTVIENSLSRIEEIARQTVCDNGYDYPVNVSLSYEVYPTRNYESYCFPSGEYLSLKISIGNAVGQNWWCVLFPPMCLSAAKENADASIQAGLTGEQYNIITETQKPKYKIRFKILEAFGSVFK